MRKDEDGEFWNILIGAAVGFVVGAGVSIVTQAMAGELDFTSGKTWAHIGISALSGTITGGFAASGVPLGGQIIGGVVPLRDCDFSGGYLMKQNVVYRQASPL